MSERPSVAISVMDWVRYANALEQEIATLKRWQEDAFEVCSNIDLDIERIRKERDQEQEVSV